MKLALRPTTAVSPTRKRIALAIAALADAVQLGLFPVFAEGALSIPDDALDAVVAVLLVVTGARGGAGPRARSLPDVDRLRPAGAQRGAGPRAPRGS
jgi:hypothetical protein